MIEKSRFVGEGAQFGIRKVEDVYWTSLINCAIATNVCYISPTSLLSRLSIGLDLANEM